MRRDRLRAKFIPDPLLGQLVEKIAYSDCSARASPYLVEAASRLQARPMPFGRRLLAWLAG